MLNWVTFIFSFKPTSLLYSYWSLFYFHFKCISQCWKQRHTKWKIMFLFLRLVKEFNDPLLLCHTWKNITFLFISGKNCLCCLFSLACLFSESFNTLSFILADLELLCHSHQLIHYPQNQWPLGSLTVFLLALLPFQRGTRNVRHGFFRTAYPPHYRTWIA